VTKKRKKQKEKKNQKPKSNGENKATLFVLRYVACYFFK